MNNRRYFSSER